MKSLLITKAITANPEGNMNISGKFHFSCNAHGSQVEQETMTLITHFACLLVESSGMSTSTTITFLPVGGVSLD